MSTLRDLMDLHGRRALITGATGGIGRIMAATLAELGADLLLIDRPNSPFTEVTEDIIRRWGVMVDCIVCDLEQESQRAELIHGIANTPQELNILINNAAFVGTSDLHGWSVPFQKQTVDTWRRALEVNLSAVFDLCKGLAPVLAQSAGASVINVASIYGYLGPDWRLYDGTTMANPAAYAASKGGLIQFTRWLATTLAPAVRVNAISPGGVYRGQPEEFVQRYASRTPLGRMATEDDFRGTVAFLASDLSRYMTGQNLKVDGGWGIW